jgi:hypothetical protein
MLAQSSAQWGQRDPDAEILCRILQNQYRKLTSLASGLQVGGEIVCFELQLGRCSSIKAQY